MEKLVHRESVLLAHGGAGTQVFSENSPKTPYRNSEDLNFKDVFGGPPRCYSMQDVRLRYSFGETIEPEEEKVTSPWNVLKEKPVFGEESITRIRNNSNDFFHDIFKGDESYISPRRTDRDRDSIFGSSPGSRIMSPSSRTMSPGSRIMSPARPLPPKAESFRTSVLAQFSLPEKLTKTMELPSFGSRNRTPSKMDGITNGSSSPCSPITASLSRFSSQTNRDQDDITNDARRTVYRQSPLSHAASFSSEDSSFSFMSDQKEGVENLKKDTKTVEPPQTYNQFHFSIYKWPERGVPMLFPLVNTNNLKSKDTNRNEKCAGSNGRIENENTKTNEGLSENMEPKPLELEREMRVSITKEDVKELKNNVEKSSDGIPESKSQSNTKDAVVFDRALKSAKAEVKSLNENDAREKSKKQVLLRMEESLESEVKTTHAALNDAIEQQGNVTEMKENKTRTPKAANINVNASKSLNKNEETGTHSNREDVDITSSMNKSRVKGKVKEFVQIFNQETDSKPKPDIQMRSQSNRWRTVNIDRTENHEATLNAGKIKEQVNLNSVEKRLAGSVKVDKNLSYDGVKQHFHTKSPDHVSTKIKSAVSSDSLTQDSKLSPQNADDDHFEDNFLVEELSVDHENITQNGDDSEYTTKASDAKIHQWSIGKKGNIRSLLSTLQNVLWAGSGWKPVPLVDLIETNSVKRAYQKALLYLHPDKLQQRGAASHQKYIAEKVFEILQEAWDQCNSLAHN